MSFVPFAPAPVTFTNTGTLTKAPGTGTSTLAQVLDNSGTIDLTSGTLGTGTFTQTSSGVLLLQLTGSTPGSSFGVLAVNGTAALSGTLQITDPGYQPPPGSAYPFLTYQASNGAFTAVDGPVGGPAFSITYGHASVAATAGR